MSAHHTGVDAGWLFAAGTTATLGSPAERRDIVWEPASLIESLVEKASTVVPASSELLRTYWYDGAPNRLPVGLQNNVAGLSDVKLRLGRTARGGQKGVDGLIIHDLITHAFRRTIDDAVVVSGDEDLLDAIESAQANGTRVHLVEIPIGGIAAPLLRAVDRTVVLGQEFWSTHLDTIESEPEVVKSQPDAPAEIPRTPEPELEDLVLNVRSQATDGPLPPPASG